MSVSVPKEAEVFASRIGNIFGRRVVFFLSRGWEAPNGVIIHKHPDVIYLNVDSEFVPSMLQIPLPRSSLMYLLDFKATMTLVTGYDAKRRSSVMCIKLIFDLTDSGNIQTKRLPTLT